MSKRAKGNVGEDKACSYLQEQGLIVVKRNYKRMFGEVDIIAIESETIIFVEVKSWDSYGFSDLEYAINKIKQNRIIRTALDFLAEFNEYESFSIRFDVIFLSRKTGEFHHLKNAFEGDGAPV